VGVIPLKVRNERSTMLRILWEEKRRKYYEENLGHTFRVIYEDEIEEGRIHGFTERYSRGAARYAPLLLDGIKWVALGEINEQGTVEVREPETMYESHE